MNLTLPCEHTVEYTARLKTPGPDGCGALSMTLKRCAASQNEDRDCPITCFWPLAATHRRGGVDRPIPSKSSLPFLGTVTLTVYYIGSQVFGHPEVHTHIGAISDSVALRRVHRKVYYPVSASLFSCRLLLERIESFLSSFSLPTGTVSSSDFLGLRKLNQVGEVTRR